MPFPSHSSRVEPASGFHPYLSTDITHLRPLGGGLSASPDSNAEESASTASCSLHILYAFGSDIILDQYQLRQLHDEGRLIKARLSPTDGDVESSTIRDHKGKGKAKGSSINAALYLGGQLDLEAPVSRVSRTDSAIAFLSVPMAASPPPQGQQKQNTPPGQQIPSVDVTVDLPLHLRYQEPVLSRWLTQEGRSGFGGSWWSKNSELERQDVVDVHVPWPCVFWACDSIPAELAENASPYRKMDAASSCIGLVPQELRSSMAKSSPLHPETTHPYHYLLPLSLNSTVAATAGAHVQAQNPQGRPGESVVRVPTGVLGDLKVVSIVNLLATWVGVVVLIRQAWVSSRKWKQERSKGDARLKAKEEKSQ